MTPYRIEREQWLPRPPCEVFAFFADARHLEALTPRWLGFRIHPPVPLALCEGARIDYTIRLGGVPLRWRTLISEWKPGERFVDVQERGPYASWVHEHDFVALGGGVRMRDRVLYTLPFGPLGRATHAALVHGLLARIFDYRFERVRARFGEEGGLG